MNLYPFFVSAAVPDTIHASLNLIPLLLCMAEMISHLVGLLGLVLAKIKLLDATRRLCERFAGTSHDGQQSHSSQSFTGQYLSISTGYITASVNLAQEYVKLGKTGKASAIYGQTLIAIRNGGPSDEVRTVFLLRYSESLATVTNVLRRYACEDQCRDSTAHAVFSSTTYCEALSLAEMLPVEDKSRSTSQRLRARVGSLERAALAAHTYGLIQYARVGASLNSLAISLISVVGRPYRLTRRHAPISSVVESCRGYSCALNTTARVFKVLLGP